MDEIPKIKRHERGDRLAVQAQQVWVILSGYSVLKKKTIAYGDLALLMGFEDKRAGHMLGRQLGIVGHYCLMNELPPLNAIAVGANSKVPGSGVVKPKRWTNQEAIDAVLDEDWFAYRVPTTGTLRQVWDAMNND
jgi:hypothetical protein